MHIFHFIKRQGVALTLLLQCLTMNLALAETGGESMSAQAQQFQNKAQNVYELSMPLLADPKLYQQQQFENLLAKTKEYKDNKEMGWMSSEEFRLWMRGRQLLIAMNAGKDQEAKAIASNLQTMLKPELYRPTQYNDSSNFACWALGYLQAYYAQQNHAAYEDNKAALQEAVAYQRIHYNALSGQAKKEFFSDVMWSYAMAVQAAAWAGDRSSYENYMQGLGELTGKDSTAVASVAAMPDDQFPAWLAGIVYRSSHMMGDPAQKALYQELLKARQRSTKEQDKMLSFSYI